MTIRPDAKAAIVTVCLLAAPGVGHAQRATENAVTSADDAFGSNVGLETTGIYTEFDTRGFSPQKAGNTRLDGIYYDQVATLSTRLRSGTAIRVGFAAEDYPFLAPTGVVDNRLRPDSKEYSASLAYNLMPYGGYIAEFDLSVPIVPGKIHLVGGAADADTRNIDGARMLSGGATVRAVFRLGGIEFSPFAAYAKFRSALGHPLVVVGNGFIPELPKKRLYLGQDWAKSTYGNSTYGAFLKAPISDRLSLRGGLFYSVSDRADYYSEIYSILDATGLARHRLIADPAHDIHSLSGEAQLALRLGGTGGFRHRIIAGYRFRNRLTETGGSDVRDFGLVNYGDPDPEAKPAFSFSRVTVGRVRQSAMMLGYIGRLDGVGSINIGVQKASYRASCLCGISGALSTTRDNPWLYNASLTIEAAKGLSFHASSVRGLEDSGTAPENALNRNEQMPATRTQQYEAGVRWKFPAGQLVVNAFQIEKPYFSFDAANRFSALGQVRHRGVETSLNLHMGKRLSLLAGVVAMQPRVSGAAHDLGLVGDRPTGTPSLFARIDANYRTAIFGGLTPTASVIYTGKRAAGSKPLAPGAAQLMLPGYASVDLGVRQQFRIGKIPASFRIVVNNVFDRATWKVAASNTLYPEERRRLQGSITADF